MIEGPVAAQKMNGTEHEIEPVPMLLNPAAAIRGVHRIVVQLDPGANFQIGIRPAQPLDLIEIDAAMVTVMTASGLPDVAEQLSGQTAVVTGDKDVAPVAKVLKTFAAEFKIAAVKIGVVDKSVLSTAEVESLADLPSREVLLAQFLGVLSAPATKLVRILNEPAASLARLLNAKAGKEGQPAGEAA